MASNADVHDQNKPVTGYPSQAGQVATGYPRAAPVVEDAYFYSPPPPSPYFAAAPATPYYHPRRRYHSSFLFRMIAAMLFVFFVMGVIFFIIWLVVRPRLPEFRVTSASVSVAPLNSTSSQLTATWDLSILVANPNTKLSIFYNRLEASVFYGDGFLLSQTELAPFLQSKGNQTLLTARIAVVGANVGNDVVKAISEDKKNGSVSFGVRVLALVRFRSGGWRTRERLMRVYCFDVKIGYSSSSGPGSLLNPSKECEVEL